MAGARRWRLMRGRAARSVEAARIPARRKRRVRLGFMMVVR
jgi:hypothetical protein